MDTPIVYTAKTLAELFSVVSNASCYETERLPIAFARPEKNGPNFISFDTTIYLVVTNDRVYIAAKEPHLDARYGLHKLLVEKFSEALDETLQNIHEKENT